jgi:hypothetical protein
MAKNKKAHLTYHSIPPPTNKRQGKHQHVAYSLPTSGKLKVSSTYVTTTAPDLDNEPSPPDATEPIEDICIEDIFDPAYLEHLEEMSTESTESTKRRHTAAVSL